MSSLFQRFEFVSQDIARDKFIFPLLNKLQWSINDVVMIIEKRIIYISNKINKSFLLRVFIKLPLFLMYYFYITLPLFWFRLYVNFVLFTLAIICKRSLGVKKILRHLSALLDIFLSGIFTVFNTKISDLIIALTNIVLDILKSWIYKESKYKSATPLLGEISELIYYEESEEVDTSDPIQRKMRKMMHTFIPPNPFKATVRLRTTPKSVSDVSSYTTALSYATDIEAVEVDSPVSFPTSPFSRAKVMNRSTEKVSSVMFTARDLLRLETQSHSRDDYSKKVAIENRTKRQFAAFDPNQASSGLVLTCGNHCIYKNGDILCCSCRSMLPIPSNTYTYFEFSLTATYESNPLVCIGLSTSKCPLNVMIGSWEESIGLYSDGQLLAESKWYPNMSQKSAITVKAGSTVGILVYKSVVNNTDINKYSTYLYLRFNINSIPLSFDIAESTLSKTDGLSSEIYPSVSILSEGTRVWCRFCEADIVNRSRISIGAPDNVKVYCLDGSLLLG